MILAILTKTEKVIFFMFWPNIESGKGVTSNDAIWNLSLPNYPDLLLLANLSNGQTVFKKIAVKVAVFPYQKKCLRQRGTPPV